MCSDKSNYINGQNIIIDGEIFMLKNLKTRLYNSYLVNHNGNVKKSF